MRALATRALVVALLASGTMLLGGCISVETRFSLLSDGKMGALIRIGMDERLGAEGGMAPGETFKELRDGAKGGSWKIREFTEGRWKYAEAVGEAGPNESIFDKEDKEAPQLKHSRIEHRLTTRYELRMAPPSAKGVMPTPGSEGATSGKGEEVPGVNALMENMFSGVRLKFQLAAPGYLVSTNGQAVGANVAQWTPSVQGLMEDQPETLVLVTEAINWTNVGRLADQIAQAHGLYDAGSRLAQGLQQGLLPNPSLRHKEATRLSPQDYYRLLEILRQVEPVVPAGRLPEVIRKLGLNTDSVTPAEIKAVHDRVTQPTFAEHMANERVREALKTLGSL